MANYVLHPVPLFLLSCSVIPVTATHTTRGSPLRYVALAVLLLVAIIFPFSLQHFARPTGWAGQALAGAALWNCVTCFDRLILRGWDYDHYGSAPDDIHVSTTGPGEKAAEGAVKKFAGSRSEFGSEVAGLSRGVDRFWEVKNVPYFSAENPYFVPTPGAFILVQGFAIAACYYMSSLTTVFIMHQDTDYLRPDRVPLFTRLPDLTTAELRARILVILGFWVVTYCNLQYFYSVFAVLGCISNPGEIRLWRPLYGNLSEAYTIRNFWGKLWHQALRSGLEGVADFITHGVMHLPSRGVLQRYSKILFAFLVSGLMHTFSDMGGGLTMRQSGALHFFSMQAVGIMIEDGVVAIFKNINASKISAEAERAGRIVGYIWVLFFLVWTSPAWMFPVATNMKEEDAFLSLVAVRPLFGGR